MSLDRENQDGPMVRMSYVAPSLRVLGTFQALTQTTTCAKGYDDGDPVGCMNSSKKS